MWAIIELIVIIAIVLVSVTEFFIPLIMGKPLFGSFRKTKPAEPGIYKVPLDEKISNTKEKVENVKVVVKGVQNEADQNFKTAEQLKEDSDNLLK